MGVVMVMDIAHYNLILPKLRNGEKVKCAPCGGTCFENILMMAIASIHIIPIKANSEIHNKRLKDYDYVRKDLSHLNEAWEVESISMAMARIKEAYMKCTGQKMQKRATPIREGVVNLNAQHSMADLKRLSKALENEFGIKAIQIYIHRDEGHYRTKASDENWKPNLHAHIVFDWTDKNGKSIKLNRIKMSKMQDLVAEQLSMERGKYATVTGKKHLNPVQFKLEKLKEQEKKQLLEIDRLAEIERKGKNLEIELEISRKNYLEQKEMEMELSDKIVKMKKLIDNDMSIEDFEKTSMTSMFLGTEKKIDRNKVLTLLDAFSANKKALEGWKQKYEGLEKRFSEMKISKESEVLGWVNKLHRADLEKKELEKKLKQWEGLSIEELQDIIDRKKQKMKEWQERKEVIEMLTPMAFKKAFEVNQNKTVWEDVYFELEQLVIGKIGKRVENKSLMERAMLKFQEKYNIEFKKSRRLGL